MSFINFYSLSCKCNVSQNSKNVTSEISINKSVFFILDTLWHLIKLFRLWALRNYILILNATLKSHVHLLHSIESDLLNLMNVVWRFFKFIREINK